MFRILMEMCLAIPAKVVTIEQDNVTLVSVEVGDYVLVHAGYAIQVLDKEEALETLRLWNEILEFEPKEQ